VPVNEKQYILSIVDRAKKALKNHKEIEALGEFHKISDTVTDDIETLISISLLAIQLKEYAHAIAHLNIAIGKQPENASLHSYLASALIRSRHISQAKEHLDRAIELNPDQLDAIINLGLYEMQYGSNDAAIRHLEKAIRLKPGNPAPYYHIIPVLRDLDRDADAIAYSRKLVNLQPDAPALSIHARLLIDSGELDDALTYLNKAVRADRTYGWAYLDIASITKFNDGDRKKLNKIEKVLDNDIPTDSRSQIHFCLGKAYDDLQQWDTAFEHYTKANILARPAVYANANAMLLKKTKKILTSKVFRNPGLSHNNSKVPVFIISMPRSGSTLVEQIIASHPDAAGAGELMEISLLCNEICLAGQSPKKIIDDIGNAIDANEDYLLDISNRYLEVLGRNREDKKRIVDKQIGNFIYLHFIHMLFPDAYVINITRNPIDTCLSCYFQSLQEVDWSFDLEKIADEYSLYVRTVNEWKKRLPGLKILDIAYESLVDSPEHEIKKIIKHIDLTWDERCLEFHKNRSTIKTASLWQARQPIYSSSKYRWVNYAKHIAPLARKLARHLDDEDIRLLNQYGISVNKNWISKLLP